MPTTTTHTWTMNLIIILIDDVIVKVCIEHVMVALAY